MSTLIVYEDVHPIWKDEPQVAKFPLESGTVDYWVDIMIDCMPAKAYWPWQRWFCEVHVRRSLFPASGQENQWYHYYQDDFYVSSLRRAYWKADDLAWKLQERMQKNPEERPDDLPFLGHSHPDQ